MGSKTLSYCCGESQDEVEELKAEVTRLRALIAQKDAKVASLETCVAQQQRILTRTFGKDGMWQLLDEEMNRAASLEAK